MLIYLTQHPTEKDLWFMEVLIDKGDMVDYRLYSYYGNIFGI